MAHPYIEINKKSWGIILNSFKECIALISSETGSPQTQVEGYLKQYSSAINTNSEAIFTAASHGIHQYINFYKVSPQEGIYDEFKNIYFLGVAITIWLNKLGLVDLNKLHQKAMLRLLDLRLLEPYGAFRPALSSRIVRAINYNVLDEHYGAYGWYLIYKCLFNAASDKAKDKEKL
jgi:hypothetical protein